MKRVQMRRGVPLPPNTKYVGRPTRWGNPFRVQGDWITWAAIALGQRADAAGRRTAAVSLYRAWMTDQLPVAARPAAGGDSAEIEFADGTRRTISEQVAGVAALATTVFPQPRLPDERPSLEPLRGFDLACWCPLDQPCHADVLLELLA